MLDSERDDIVTEALDLFRANSLFRNFEIKGPADRVLIYLILFIGDCLSRISTSQSISAYFPHFPLPTLYFLPSHFLASSSYEEVQQLIGNAMHSERNELDRPGSDEATYLLCDGELYSPRRTRLPSQLGLCSTSFSSRRRCVLFCSSSRNRQADELWCCTDALRQYLTQARQETVLRLTERVYDAQSGGKPSKWWMCFQVSPRPRSPTAACRIDCGVLSITLSAMLITLRVETEIHGEEFVGVIARTASSEGRRGVERTEEYRSDHCEA